MNKINPYITQLLVILFFIAPILAECDCTQESVTGIYRNQCEALLAFYNATGGDETYIYSYPGI